MTPTETSLSWKEMCLWCRYGPCHPVFFQGSLSEALQASCQKPCREVSHLLLTLMQTIFRCSFKLYQHVLKLSTLAIFFVQLYFQYWHEGVANMFPNLPRMCSQQMDIDPVAAARARCKNSSLNSVTVRLIVVR